MPIIKEDVKDIDKTATHTNDDHKSSNIRGTNHYVQECSVPSVTEIAEGDIVMLTKNQIVELLLIDKSIGTVVGRAVYENMVGTLSEVQPIPAYVVVNFPQCRIP